MSSPDRIAKLKARVEVYESELQEAQKILQTNPQSGNQTQQMVWNAALLKFFDVSAKLLNAYREYSQELEKLAPR